MYEEGGSYACKRTTKYNCWNSKQRRFSKSKKFNKKFGVTEDSIRKDLAHLEKDGMLKKTYGGAVRVRTTVMTDMFHRE